MNKYKPTHLEQKFYNGDFHIRINNNDEFERWKQYTEFINGENWALLTLGQVLKFPIDFSYSDNSFWKKIQ